MIPKKYKVGEFKLDPSSIEWKEKVYDYLSEALTRANDSVGEVEYRKQADEGYKYYAGDQDTEWVKAKSEELDLPLLTFNHIKAKIDVLTGLASDMRKPPLITGFEESDDPVTEIFSTSAKYYRHKVRVTQREVDTFDHSIKGGRAFLYYYVDTENPFAPKIMCKKALGHEIIIDQRSSEQDLSDARFVGYSRWFSEEELKAAWPESFKDGLLPGNNYVAGESSEAGSITNNSSQSDSVFWNDKNKDSFRVVEMWYWDIDYGYWFINAEKEPEFVTEDNWSATAEALANEGLEHLVRGAIQGTKKRMKYAILGPGEVLEEGYAPRLYTRFPIAQCSAYKNDVTNNASSVVSTMKDAQIAKNSIARQLIHMLLTSTKPLLMAEAGAILNEEEYKENSAKANFILKLAGGALSGRRVQQSNQAQISPIYGQLASSMDEEMKTSSGIQNDIMGIQTSSREPGISVQLRQQGILATLRILFDNYKTFRVDSQIIMLFMIQSYVTETDVIRIMGQGGAELIKLTGDQFKRMQTLEYDVTIDEDTEGTMRLAIGKMLMDLNQNNPGMIPAEIIAKYLGLPFSVTTQIQNHNQNTAESQQAAQEEETLIKWATVAVKLQKGIQQAVKAAIATKDKYTKESKNAKRR